MFEQAIQIFIFIYKILSVVTPLINYLPQYFLIKRENSTGTFAKETCLVLIVTNLLRVIFWFRESFELCLLIQAIVVIGLQILLLSLVIQTRQIEYGNLLKARNLGLYSGLLPRVSKKLPMMLFSFIMT